MEKRKILLVIENNFGKYLFFILDNLKVLTLDEIIREINKGNILGLQIVAGKTGKYIRSKPNDNKQDNLDTCAVSLSAISRTSNQNNSAAWKKYDSRKVQALKENERLGKEVIYVDGKIKKTKNEVVAYLAKYQKDVLAAAKHFNVDPYLLGAILIDEYVRLAFSDVFDRLAMLGINTSVGLAQIKVETARELIKKGYYNPAPKSPNPSNKNIYKYLRVPRHSIYFAAANIRRLLDKWAPFVDLSDRPEIIGVLYSKDGKPHKSPKTNLRGVQTKKQFYLYAKEALD